MPEMGAHLVVPVWVKNTVTQSFVCNNSNHTLSLNICSLFFSCHLQKQSLKMKNTQVICRVFRKVYAWNQSLNDSNRRKFCEIESLNPQRHL